MITREEISIFNLLSINAEIALKLQNSNGSFEGGKNGPRNQLETGVRNTSCWTLLFAYMFKNTGKLQYKEACQKGLNYLKSNEVRPHNRGFYCIDPKIKRATNGLVGQAWVLEALIIAGDIVEDCESIELAQEVYHLHPFNFKWECWEEIDYKGENTFINKIFNQQLWFAAIGSELKKRNLLSYSSEKELKYFFEKMNSKWKVTQKGLIVHNSPGLFGDKNDRYAKFKRHIKNLKNYNDEYNLKSIGYHSFNTYALSIIAEANWESVEENIEKVNKTIDFISTKEYKQKIVNNPFGYGYNHSGIENAYTLSVFRPDLKSLQQDWLDQQAKLTINKNDGMLTNNTLDKKTSAARISELCRYPDWDVKMYL